MATKFLMLSKKSQTEVEVETRKRIILGDRIAWDLRCVLVSDGLAIAKCGDRRMEIGAELRMRELF